MSRKWKESTLLLRRFREIKQFSFFFSYCILLTLFHTNNYLCFLIAIEKKEERNCSSFISSNATTYCYILNTKESSSSIQEYSGRIRNIPNEDQYCTELTRIYLSDEKEKKRIHICTVKVKGHVHRHIVNSSAWLLIYEKMSCWPRKRNYHLIVVPCFVICPCFHDTSRTLISLLSMWKTNCDRL